jgi:hypothetical protein
MKVLAAIFRELKGLFVEDNRLAVAIVALVAVAIGIHALGAPAALIGFILIGGSLGLLTENVMRARKKAPPGEPPKP